MYIPVITELLNRTLGRIAVSDRQLRRYFGNDESRTQAQPPVRVPVKRPQLPGLNIQAARAYTASRPRAARSKPRSRYTRSR